VPITPVRYAYDLVDAYHNSHMTTRNYRHAAARFRVLGRPEVSAYLEKHAREETGHDRLALKDLRALGIPAEQVVENLVPEGKRPLWRRFDRLSFADYPLGCIGFSYSFERLAAFKSKEDVDTVRAILPPGIDATRFLRAHSSLGSEVVHAEDLIDFISSLPADDRTAIAKATYGTALLMGAGNLHNRHKPEAEMWSEIEAAAGEPILLAA
jgi:hypothetical protein